MWLAGWLVGAGVMTLSRVEGKGGLMIMVAVVEEVLPESWSLVGLTGMFTVCYS